MKKISIFMLALTLCFGLGMSESLADVQIDSGQTKSTSAKKFFIGRVGRISSYNNGNVISAGSIVVWDSASDDGVTVFTSTTTGDNLVAGVTIDAIPGSSRDNTAVEDDAYPNWGRIQTWGLHNSVRVTVANLSVGDALKTSATAGSASNGDSTSADIVGVALDTSSAVGTIQVMLK